MATKIDFHRVAASALEAALGEEPAPRHRSRGVRTLATGAALVTAAQVGRKHLPRVTKARIVAEGLAKLEDMPNVRDIKDAVRERFSGHAHDDAEDEFEDYDDEDDEDEFEDPDDQDEDDDEDQQDDEDQPSGEGEEEDEPSGESDEEDEPSGESDEEEPRSEDEGAPALDIGSAREAADATAPDLVDALSTPRK